MIIALLFIGLRGYSQNTLDSGLVAWYPFNGNTLDESGNGHNGINHGATLTMDRDSNSNSAYYFDGWMYHPTWDSVNDYIDINNDTQLQLSNTDYTISTWIKRKWPLSLDEDIIISKKSLVAGWSLHIST